MRAQNALLQEAIISAGVFSILLGLVYLLGPDASRTTVALNAVKAVAPLWCWAWLFLLIGLLMILSAFASWTQAAYAMFASAAMFVMWAFGFAWSAAHNGGIGLVGALFAVSVAFNKVLFGRACAREATR